MRSLDRIVCVFISMALFGVSIGLGSSPKKKPLLERLFGITKANQFDHTCAAQSMIDLMNKLGLQPTWAIRYKNAHYSFSKPFIAEFGMSKRGTSRVSVLAIIEVDGKKHLRWFIKSQSRVFFKLLPAINTVQSVFESFNKGHSHEALNLPPRVLVALENRYVKSKQRKVSFPRIDVSNFYHGFVPSSSSFDPAGLKEHTQLRDVQLKKPETLEDFVTFLVSKQINPMSIVTFTDKHHFVSEFLSEDEIKTAVEEKWEQAFDNWEDSKPPTKAALVYVKEGFEPDYAKHILSFPAWSEPLGEVQAHVYQSKNNEIQWVLVQTPDHKAFFSHGYDPKSTINKFGVPTIAIKSGDYTTPLLVYTGQVEGFDHERVPVGFSKYIGAWDYTRRIHDISRWHSEVLDHKIEYELDKTLQEFLDDFRRTLERVKKLNRLNCD